MKKKVNKEAFLIEEMFNKIAPSYDKVNHILSLNIDKKWRKKLVRRLPENHTISILDIATGTGDLAIMMAKHCNRGTIKAVDISQNMLDIARKKAYKEHVDDKILFRQANVEQLPFEDNTFHFCTVAFGVRNFENLNLALSEIYRCTKPGGKIYILEFAKTPSSQMLKIPYKIYSRIWIPFIGGLISRNTEAYTYLPNSISDFIYRRDFTSMLYKIGFSIVKYQKFTGGIALLYEGTKL